MDQRERIWNMIEEFANLKPTEFRRKLEDKAVARRLASAGATRSDIAKIILFKEDGNPSPTLMEAFVIDNMER